MGASALNMLSEALGDEIDVTLIDKNDAFVFGYAKLDVMFGRTTRRPSASRTATSPSPACASCSRRSPIDPEGRRVTTDAGEHDADVLVVALGADYDLDATGARGRQRVLLLVGAERLREALPTFVQGRAIIGVCGAPFKCPPPRARPRCCCTTTCRRAASATMRDLVRDPVRGPVRLTGYVSRACCRLRRAHRVRAGQVGTRPGTACRRARRRVRSSTTSSSASRSTAPPTWSSQADDRRRLRAREPGDARDAVSGRIRLRRRRDDRRYPRLECSPRERRVLSPPR